MFPNHAYGRILNLQVSNTPLDFKNGINNIQTTAYNDACTLYINGSPIVESYESFIDILSNLLRLVVKLSLENAKHK